ncbi:MAG: hypothetical protein JKX85_09755 [Phycisphaeraceae bacterium]|nr:hypothetical protein [Phycisphaeraceae bacterium]
MILRIPVTKVYEVHVTDKDDGQLATRSIVNQVKGQASHWSVEQVQERGKLVGARTGDAAIVCADYPGDMPCTD